MSANQLLITQENASGDFAIKTVTPEAGKVLGFNSGLEPVMVDAGSGGGGTSTVFYSQTNLNIDGAIGNFFLVTLSANASFTLANIEVGVQYYFVIKNSGSSTTTVTLPNTADIKSAMIINVSAYKTVELAMIFDGTNRIWQISEELV